MNTGTHLPPYVFFEQFVAKQRVLDLFPPDDQGTEFLRRSAQLVVSVHQDRESTAALGDDRRDVIIAAKDNLPFAPGSFDLVFFFAQNQAARLPNIAEYLKSARTLVGQNGLVGLAIPNRDARGFEGGGDADLPRYFDFERSLRRHFPHVITLASKPLHGATVSSIGRGEGAAAPLLDERLLPESGETPSYFIGVCSLRYRRVDESMIVKAPYRLLADPIRKKTDRLRSNISIAMSESELRAREIEKLEVQIDEMKERVERAEIVKHEKASALSLLRDAERQLKTKNKVQREFADANEKLLKKIAEVEQSLFDAEHRIRKEEQKSVEAEQKIVLAQKQRENAEQERENLLSALRTAKAEVRARQRELDDSKEENAGAEADLSALRAEVDRQRRETFTARERATKLELELLNFSEHQTEIASFEAELERVRTMGSSDRDRLESRLEEEHNRVLEEIDARSKADKRILELQKKIETTDTLAVEAARRTELLQERLERATNQLEANDTARREAQRAKDELEHVARERRDEIDRYKHQMEILSSRADQSEARATELAREGMALKAALESSESKLHELKTFKKIALEEAKEQKVRLAKLSQNLDTQGAENRRLLQENKDVERTLSEENKEQKGRVARLLLSLDAQRDENRKLMADFEELETKLSGDAIAKKANIVKLTQDLEARGAENEKLTFEVQEIAAKLNSAEAKQIEIESAKELREHLARATEKNGQFVEELASIKSSLSYQKELVRVETQRGGEAELRERKAMERAADLEDEVDKAGARALRLEDEIASYKAELEDMHNQILQLESALSDAEKERTDARVSTEQLLMEKEAEVLKVSDDLEKELRLATARYEKSGGEIWNLNEEIVRLRAQYAAAEAVDERLDKVKDYAKSQKKTDAVIVNLTRERNTLRQTCDRYARIIKQTKKELAAYKSPKTKPVRPKSGMSDPPKSMAKKTNPPESKPKRVESREKKPKSK